MPKQKKQPRTLQYLLTLTDGRTKTVWVTGDKVTWGQGGSYVRHPSDADMDAVMRHVANAMEGTLEKYEMQRL